MRADREEYVEKITRWLVDWDKDPELSKRVRESTGLDGVYRGTSQRIRDLVKLAYLRGCRRGASCAWEAKQPISLRKAREEGSVTTIDEFVAKYLPGLLPDKPEILGEKFVHGFEEGLRKGLEDSRELPNK